MHKVVYGGYRLLLARMPIGMTSIFLLFSYGGKHNFLGPVKDNM